MESSKDKQIDWKWFDSLSESEQIKEMKTWDNDMIIAYETRDGVVPLEEVIQDLHNFIDTLEDKWKEQ